MKKNCRLISRRCSRAEKAPTTRFALIGKSFSSRLTDALPLAVTLTFAVSFSMGLPESAFAAPTPARPALEAQLRSEIELHAKTKSSSFETLLSKWQKTHGPKAAESLEKIAADRGLKDQARYISMMGAVRLGGEKSLPALMKQSNDRSWMVRSGVLKAVELTHSARGVAIAEKMLKDPALVIRTQAVETLIELNPPHLKELLVKAAFDPLNYRGGSYKKGRAEWVPQRALAGLRKIHAKDVSARLVPLLSDAQDPKLRAHALFTIESLEGRKLETDGSFEKRAKAWTKHFANVGKGDKPRKSAVKNSPQKNSTP